VQLEDFLPSIERVKARGHRVRAGGLGGLFGRDMVTASGVTREQVAAVLVSCRGIVRTRKESQRRIGPHRAALMFRGEPPPPPVVELRHTEVLLGVQPPEPCAACGPDDAGALRPGVRRCNECSGTGRVAASDPMAGLVGGLVVAAVIEAVGSTCPWCHGQKVVACPTCEGTGQAIPALIGAVTDTPVAFSHVYVPGLSAALESKLEEALSATRPPDCLRIDPPKADADFAGFAFGNRLELARAAVERTVGDGEILMGTLECFAWPLLVMRSDAGGAEAVVYTDAGGKLRTLA
jgi:hypothetical protein